MMISQLAPIAHMMDLIDACQAQARAAEVDPLPAIRTLAKAHGFQVHDDGPAGLLLTHPRDPRRIAVCPAGRASLTADAGPARPAPRGD